jgi:hypothetical protein
MPWNPSPKVADCRAISRKWGCEQVIILGISAAGRMQMATFGATPALCRCAGVLGEERPGESRRADFRVFLVGLLH